MINTQNINDSECFKWSIVKYLNSANHQTARIIKADKDFAKKLDFKDIKFSVKVRDIQKLINWQKILLALVFLTMKIKKNIQSMHQKNVVKKNILIYY